MMVILGLLIATAGAALFYKLKIPAGVMIGALALVAVYNILTGDVSFPPYMKTVSQILTGAFIGVSIRSDVIGMLKKLALPALVIPFSLMVCGLLIGFIVYRVTDYDLVTCLLATSPGGIADMALIGMDMGADTSIMAVLHLVRLLSIICIWPPLSKLILRHVYKSQTVSSTIGIIVSGVSEEEKQADKAAHPDKLNPTTVIKLNAVTIIIGIVGGIIGYFLNIPAGVMLFSMLAVGAYNIKTDRAFMSTNMRRAAQIMAGAMVGQSFGMEQLLAMGRMIFPAVLIIVCYLTFSLLLTYLLYKRCGLDLLSSLYSGIPAGASDMALIAADMGADGPQVALLHMARLILVIAIYPQIVTLFIR